MRSQLLPNGEALVYGRFLGENDLGVAALVHENGQVLLAHHKRGAVAQFYLRVRLRDLFHVLILLQIH